MSTSFRTHYTTEWSYCQEQPVLSYNKIIRHYILILYKSNLLRIAISAYQDLFHLSAKRNQLVETRNQVAILLLLKNFISKMYSVSLPPISPQKTRPEVVLHPGRLHNVKKACDHQDSHPNTRRLTHIYLFTYTL